LPLLCLCLSFASACMALGQKGESLCEALGQKGEYGTLKREIASR